MKKNGYAVSDGAVAWILQDLGYSLQSNFKTLEGAAHLNRDAQFEYITTSRIKGFQLVEEPVISINNKKKELFGNLK